MPRLTRPVLASCALLALSASTAPLAAQEDEVDLEVDDLAVEEDQLGITEPDEGVTGISPLRNGTVGEVDEQEEIDEPVGLGAVENQRVDDLDALVEGQRLLDQAAVVARQMRRDEDLTLLLSRAEGVFIVPEYGKGAFVVGGSGGEGVLLLNETEGWSLPIFYDIGSFEIGPAIGAAGGAIAMLLMSEEAVTDFLNVNNFSLNANADLTVVDYAANAQASWGKEDVIVWADTEGLFAGVTVGASDIVYDETMTNAYYGGDFTPSTLFHGEPIEAGGTAALRAELPG